MKHLLFNLLIVLLILLAATTQAAEPPAAPMLRLETGFHTAMIRRIATDAQGRWLATASNDKTLRLWDLGKDIRDAKNPDLIRTFRLPSGPGNEGKLFAVAMDPAGDWLATGGWTGYDWEGTHSIYILDRATGQMRRRIDGLGNVINHLCVSPDGRWLAATLGDTGLRVYDTRNSFAPSFADRDYGKDSYGCAFSPDSSSLVTTCDDGQVRRYSLEGLNTASFRKEQQAATQGGREPFAVAFHPAGDRLAIGFAGSTAVSVLDAKRLTQLYAANTNGIDNGNLGNVAWSADGSVLFAGGLGYQEGYDCPVFRWTNKGRGQRTSWQAADMTVMDLKPLPDGNLLMGTGDPALLRYDRQGRKLFDLRPNLPDLRAHYDKFQVSADGRQVSFGLKVWGNEPVCFDLNTRQVRKGECQGSSNNPLHAPRTEATGLKIANWEDEYNPTLNGKPMALKDYERSRSLAIAPDKQHFLLGTEWYLRYFDRQGREIWQQPVPGAAWGVNISGDGKLAVAAFGDGTVRWYRLSDGEPLLSLFVSVNRERDTWDAEHWVAWTPKGWYDSSPGGDSLIGWQVNNGKDRLADFFPAAQFRERFYRPDVVAKVLETLDESRAVARADTARGRTGRKRSTPVVLALPPAVELLAPADGSSFRSPTLNLRYRVRTHGPPIVAVQVRVDGGFHQRSKVQRRNNLEWEGSVDVTLPARDTRLSLLAENAEGAMSEAAVINLLWQGDKDALKPVLYLLVVGVDNYDAQEINLNEGKKYLNYAAADARDFAAMMMQQAGTGRLYRKVIPRVLTNTQADRSAVLEGLEWIEQQTTPNDVAMVFLAGHGKLNAHEDYYFLPRDFRPWRYISSAVSYDAINRTVSRIQGKALFLVDTCYSGKAAGLRGGGNVDMTKIINDLSAAENGVIVLSATTGHQKAEERKEWGHGAFTLALLEALGGNADYNTNRALTVSEIKLYISERVKTLTDSRQTPAVVIPKNVSDFPVFALP